MVSGARIRGGERKAERDHERENRHRAASGLPSLEEERAAAAREEAHVRREREAGFGYGRSSGYADGLRRYAGRDAGANFRVH